MEEDARKEFARLVGDQLAVLRARDGGEKWSLNKIAGRLGELPDERVVNATGCLAHSAGHSHAISASLLFRTAA